MPVITCPTCGTKLEIDAEAMGHPVQCGSCQQVFTAASDIGAGRSRNPAPRDRGEADDRPRGRRRHEDEDEDEDDEYDYSPRQRSRRRADDDENEDDDDYAPPRDRAGGRTPGTGMGVAALVLGLAAVALTVVGLALCCWPVGTVCAVLAVVFGCVSWNTDGRGLGIAGLALGGLSILLVVGLFVFAGGVGMLNRPPMPPPIPKAIPPVPQKQ
jgi:predicted Zn finger-like uncharacterized protein